MNSVGFIILFGLSFVLFPCQGEIIPPPDGTELTLLNGSNATITWSFDDDLSAVISRAWYFTSSDGSFNAKRLALIVLDQEPQIEKSGLSGVTIVKPATLILKNVNATYNGTYRFSLGSSTTGNSVVVVFIAITPVVTVDCPGNITLNQSDNFKCLCTGQDGNPRANVTWYGDNVLVATGIEEAILNLTNVTKNDDGTYTCVAKSHEEAKNVTKIKVTVHYSPENVDVKFERSNESVTIICDAEALPPPSFEILFNGTELTRNKTFYISEMNESRVGFYKCVASNIIGKKSSLPKYLPYKGPTTLTTTSAPTTTAATTTAATTTAATTNAITSPFTTMFATGTPGSNPWLWWYYLLIIIAVVVLLMIIAYVIYRYKQKRKDGYRGNADVSPGASAGIPVNHYELDEEPAGGVDNAYDTVNNPGATGSKSKPPENTTPDVYAAVDKTNREGKPLYATLDSLALQADNSKKKRDEERPGQTEYASIDFAKIGKADQE